MMKYILSGVMFFFLSLTVNCQNKTSVKESVITDRNLSMDLAPGPGEAVLTVAGGCFWCTEEVCERIIGVHRVISGYAGGQTKNPTYETVLTGKTGHAESIQIYYDPKGISMKDLLKVYFLAAHDPTQVNRQGPDVGTQYRSVAFYRNSDEKELIENYIEELNQSGLFKKKIATEVRPIKEFYPAEDYHQNYFPQNPDNPYIQRVSQIKVDKFEKLFPELSKSNQ